MERQPSSVGVGTYGEGFDGALEEGGERGEAGLAVLVLREVVVGLEALEPAAGFDLVAAAGAEDVVVEGEEVAGGGVVGAYVGAGAGDLGGAVGGGGAGDDDGADGLACDPAGDDGLIAAGRAEEVEGGAGVADAGGVEEVRREDVLLLDAEDLLAEGFVDEREGVGGGGVGDGVVDGVDGEEEVFGADVVVEAGGAEVFADVLRCGLE